MSKNKKSKKTPKAEAAKPARQKGWQLFVALFMAGCAMGLVFAVMLTQIYVQVRREPVYESACAINDKYNCLTVAQSEYSAVAGVPVSVFGVAGYLAMAVAAAFTLSRDPDRKRAAALLTLALTAGGFVFSVYLFILSEFVIKVICPYCLSTYGVNLVLLVSAVGMARVVSTETGGLFRPGLPALVRKGLPPALAGAALLALSALSFSLLFDELEVEGLKGPGGLPVGITEDGHPWIGATRPALTIVEFSDYQCPHCRRAHNQLRELVAEFKDQVRAEHRHLPLDQQCHPLVNYPMHEYACNYALYGVCAAEQGAEEFWRLNDLLFALPPDWDFLTSEEAAREADLDPDRFIKCLRSAKAGQKVIDDIKYTMEKNIDATPTFLVDGNPIEVDRETIKALIDLKSK